MFFALFCLAGLGAGVEPPPNAMARNPPGEAPPDDRDEKPNILFIFTDDHSTAAISAYGSRINKTPALDRLSSEGMRFDQTFCTNAICAPSRAVILTGKHSHVNGVIDNRKRFDGSQMTFPKRLRKAGYQTAMIGKWHLKSDPTGFDFWKILPGQGQYYNPDFRTAEGRERFEGHSTEITTDFALEWLDEARESAAPFLLMCQFKAPHRAWMPAPEYLDQYEGEAIPEPPTLFDDYETRTRAAREQEMEIDRHMHTHYDLKCWPEDANVDDPDSLAANWARDRLKRMTPEQRERWIGAYGPRNEAFHEADLSGRELVRWKYQRYIKDYLRCIAGVDDQIARLLDYLDETGLARNTIVVYSSDQGFFLGEHGWFDKRFMYEPALRTPFIVRWPGVVEPGSVDDHLVQNLDFAPTFLDAAGVEAPESMQGRSVVPILKGESPAKWRDSIYYQYYEEGVHNVAPHYGVRTDRYKLMRFPGYDGWEFYDLDRDPDETRNRYGEPEYAEIIDGLKAELARLRAYYNVPE